MTVELGAACPTCGHQKLTIICDGCGRRETAVNAISWLKLVKGGMNPLGEKHFCPDCSESWKNGYDL